MGLSALLQGATGIAGLISGMGRNRKAEEMNAAILNILKQRGQLMGQATSEALNYDPRTADRAAANYATGKVSHDLGEGLKQLNMQYRNAGGFSGGDSLFQGMVQGQMNRAADPLKGWLAEQNSMATQKKLGALGSAMGMGGDISNDYMALGQQYRTDLTPSLAAISGAADSVLPKGRPTGRSVTASSPTKSAKGNTGTR